ncbi:variant erythrocyte surface antigen-1 family protein [Babesia caballi]|uniref:Variant erythrocyte surface antigen-1 family protein n=1 Tax=Babesia caballi TaxID=5871 RepID=A0AAV4M361_BABCB|nr:variant erythrocyte surface antigen-1 family protein [Babesia caballi]
MTASGGKSLTEPPKNLKEAIDWVIKINELKKINDLAKALEALLKEEAGDVAVKVLDNYRLVSDSVIKERMSNKPSKPAHRFAVPHAILNSLSQGLKPFHPQSDANNSAEDVEKVKEWASSVDGNTLKQLIETFAGGLESFRKNILQNPNYSAYKSVTPLSSLTINDKRDCALILLGVMPVVYIGLTYLYWQCEGTDGWAQEKLDSSSGSDQGSLKQYMAAFGYTDNLNKPTTGGAIATQLRSAFSNELEKAYDSAKSDPPQSTGPSYPDFLGELKKPLETLPSPSSLTSLYLLSYYYITNFLYIVEPTSPAMPTFAGYSGTAALAGGAYGFNLGGLGTFLNALLV